MEPKKKIVITSGYFDPIHVGHINLIREAKELGDVLIVVVNNDNQIKIKKSVGFMPENERLEIIKALRHADEVVLSIDHDRSVAKTLELIAQKYDGEFYFAKGGDRNADNIPEEEKLVCEKHNIKIINGVGGGKIQSSSWLIKRAAA